MPGLTLQQLDYLVAVADASSWAEAAEGLGVTPSALSQGLRQLEHRLGVPLFDRRGRGRRLRPEGLEVLAYARGVVAASRDLARWAEAIRGGTRGAVRIGMIDVAAVVHFGPTLQAFRRLHPDIGLHLVVGPSGQLLDQLRDGYVALAVVVRPARTTGEFELVDLIEEELAVYAPSGVAERPVGEWGPWVSFPSGSHTRELVAARMVELGAPFEVVAESHQPEVLRGMVELGMGWTVLPVTQAEIEPTPLVRLRPDPILVRTLSVARRHDRLTSPVADALVERLVAHAGRPVV